MRMYLSTSKLEVYQYSNWNKTEKFGNLSEKVSKFTTNFKNMEKVFNKNNLVPIDGKCTY